jgi:23S rRNA C2498 (ribose-2'-O)-methylase RlmM
MVLGRRVCLSLGKRADVDVAALVNDTDAVVHHEQSDPDGAGGRGPVLKPGDEGRLVVTLVDRAGGSFVGVHRHRAGLSPDPGGDARLVVPSTSPSRAWLKVEEAARLINLPIVAGDAVIEVGSSPGGQTRALLDRGCVVVGIDPNAMDDGILREPRFTHVRESARHVDTTQLRAMVAGPARLLVVDVNQRPMAALSSVASIIAANRGDLRGGLFTLKLGDWALLSELPAWRARIEGLFGPGTTTMAFQLPANRVEVTVFARRPG